MKLGQLLYDLCPNTYPIRNRQSGNQKIEGLFPEKKNNNKVSTRLLLFLDLETSASFNSSKFVFAMVDRIA